MFEVDPLTDPRWTEFIGRHERASIFHTPPWLELLRRTYGFRPVVITTSPPRTELTDGLVFCRVSSWITGRRLISLPFSDHCDPLADCTAATEKLLSEIQWQARREHCKYVEIRPLCPPASSDSGFQCGTRFHFHVLDISAEPNRLFASFDKSCVQRRIRHAEREELVYLQGRGEALLRAFYDLVLLTRSRQQLPPQPFAWYENLLACMGEAARIHVVFKDSTPIAGILTLLYRTTLMCKYACADQNFFNLAGMPLVFWNAILGGKQSGARVFDMGRSDYDNTGLVTFKNRWGARQSEIAYLRYPEQALRDFSDGWKMQVAKEIFGRMSPAWLEWSGRLLYRHAA